MQHILHETQLQLKTRIEISSRQPASGLFPQDLFELGYVHDAKLSPEGRCVAYIVSLTPSPHDIERFELFMEDLCSGERHRVAYEGRVLHPRWSPNGMYLAFVGVNDSAGGLYRVDRLGGDITLLTPSYLDVEGPASWSPDGSVLVCAVKTQRLAQGLKRITRRIFRSEGLGVVDSLRSTLYLVDARAEQPPRRVELPQEVATYPLFNPISPCLLFLGAQSAVGSPSFGGLQLFRVDIDSVVPPVEVLDERWFVAAASWSPCGRQIVFAGDRDSSLTIPMARLWIIDVDGSNPRCRTPDGPGNIGLRIHHDMPTWDTSQNNLLTVPDASSAYVTMLEGGGAKVYRVALDGPICCEPVAAGPRTCVIMDANTATSQVLYGASDLHTPWELYLSDSQGNHERRLTRLNDAVLKEWPTLRVEHLKFQSNDGLPLEGWFLASTQRSGPQPTVLFIHGGPMLATGNVFRFDFHLLASNGFAVLCANFRGSSGYGEPFMRAILGDWGARGFPDHMATVDIAIERGFADSERLGVWGASHGGFATAWIVSHSTRFKAAVAEAAVINFSTLYYHCDAPDIFARDLGGRPHEIPDVYRSRSPLSYAHRCQTPTLLLHGEEDLRCPITEAEQFYRALHDVGCVTEMVRIPECDHMGDSTGPLSARLAQNEALLDWFRRFL